MAGSAVDVANHLRGLVKAAAPGAEEALRPGWHLVGYSLQQYVVGIHLPNGIDAPVFEREIEPLDYHGVLEGTGTRTHRVTAESVDEIPEGPTLDLLPQAIALQE